MKWERVDAQAFQEWISHEELAHRTFRGQLRRVVNHSPPFRVRVASECMSIEGGRGGEGQAT